MKLDDLIAQWQTDEGKPFKGHLIDYASYKEDPDNMGCMCAQGQVLHLLGGFKPDVLRDARQEWADKATAKLLNISRAHAVLLRLVNDKANGAPAVVLTDPGKVLGDRWSKLLDFWWHLDGMTRKQWNAARNAAWAAAEAAARDAAGAAAEAAQAAAESAAWAAARNAARAAGDAAGDAARNAARAAGDAAGDAAGAAAWAAAGSSVEIQGEAILMLNGRSLFFLPTFGFASSDDIPARPDNYGVPK